VKFESKRKKGGTAKPHEKYNNTILFSHDYDDITSETITTWPLGDAKCFER